jgi:hypothetical protein
MLSHDLALPGALARALSARTGRGTDVDVVASPMTTASSAPGKLAGLKPRPYAAIVVILGTHEATASGSNRTVIERSTGSGFSTRPMGCRESLRRRGHLAFTHSRSPSTTTNTASWVPKER